MNIAVPAAQDDFHVRHLMAVYKDRNGSGGRVPYLKRKKRNPYRITLLSVCPSVRPSVCQDPFSQERVEVCTEPSVRESDSHLAGFLQSKCVDRN
ncbi:hypothetical protein EVAR_6318_1 [Eumeta japonica]|uniref:Uncharacterized protein n=1 Tax=Eumeta variegata TaxID=151549 RepID=A0A4C1TBH9_EUMVA|nr:hypothetical protein EVAR_6318_1 [Eumeta japonica]